MFGDWILDIRDFFNRNFFCIHDYKKMPNYMGKTSYSYRVCSKCGKTTKGW